MIYREGSVIVREKLETEAGSPELLTAIIKRKKGFNPEANDWEFLLISGDATKIRSREKTGSCQSCHQSVSAKDFVFDSYLPTPVMSDRRPGAPAMLRFGVPELLAKEPITLVEQDLKTDVSALRTSGPIPTIPIMLKGIN